MSEIAYLNRLKSPADKEMIVTPITVGGDSGEFVSALTLGYGRKRLYAHTLASGGGTQTFYQQHLTFGGMDLTIKCLIPDVTCPWAFYKPSADYPSLDVMYHYRNGMKMDVYCSTSGWAIQTYASELAEFINNDLLLKEIFLVIVHTNTLLAELNFNLTEEVEEEVESEGGGASVFFGGSGVTPLTGMPIPNGVTVELPIGTNLDPFFVANSGESIDLRIIEFA
jgi:hypothetical protein